MQCNSMQGLYAHLTGEDLHMCVMCYRYIYMYADTHMHMVYILLHVYICVYICMYIYGHIYVCIYAHINVYIYIYDHIYVYIYMSRCL